MPGQPMKRQRIARIEAAGGITRICERVAAGEPLSAIAAEYGMGREALSRWIHQDEERAEQIRAARARAADALAEETLSIADGATAEDVQVAKLRIDTRRWIAGIWSPAVYSPQQRAAVEINIGSLHLDALRQVNAQPIIDVTPVESST